MKLFTIGFTKKSAETFFTRLKEYRVEKLVDVRLNNVSQLAGFSKKDDLRYFLREICGIDYIHTKELAPTQDILTEFKSNKGDWNVYRREFIKLMEDRRIEEVLSPQDIDGCCLLCSEESPHECHRRLIAEYLRDKWDNVDIIHIP